MEDFKYVLQRQAPGKICFGSGVERECLPIKGPAKTSLMRRFIPDNLVGPGPMKYDFKSTLLKKYPNKAGYGGLAYNEPRSPKTIASQYPAVGTYDVSPVREVKYAAKPFNIGAKLAKKRPFLTPAPGTYNFRKRNITVDEGFGKHRLNYSAVRTICTPINHARCCICEEMPLGDYWRHWTNEQDMCRPCMVKERRTANMSKPKSKKMKRLAELDKFIRVRYCDYYHEHSGTKAAIKFLSNHHLKMKFRCEDYLNMFYY
ncbi:uncharacterized protein LOC119649329 [Hermetia illucens]|uniref:uncharacterized protein LOC119649329 n=1 Tax=Hermetia illucens TaxID=343691 RepID=UPI0018CC37CB|nr:uncharacterized protein LOC119649329 [Hermetia illucens]